MLADRSQPNIMSSYIHYVGDSECPTTFTRWSMMACLGAWLGKRFYLKHGHSTISSNMYVMLMGDAGSRKSTAIKMASKLIGKAGYNNFSSSKCSKEQFLVDLANTGMPESADEILDANLWGEPEATTQGCEIFVNVDEWNDFVGNGNIEFLSLLGNLWDFTGLYKHSKLTSKSVSVSEPSVSILAGNTPTGFSLAFPKEAIGQGIFSRLLLIQGERSGKKIAFPKPPSDAATAALITCLQQIRSICNGEASISPDAKALLERCYLEWQPLNDIRFESYSNRRFTHLLKLCLICAASYKMCEILPHHVRLANTILVHAEHSMSRALGEFGSASKSDVTNKVMQLLSAATKPLTFKDMWKHVSQDLNQLSDLRPIIENLTYGDKIIKAGNGFLAKRALIEEASANDLVDFSLLTESERSYVL